MKQRGVSLLWAMTLTAMFFAMALAAAVRLDQARYYARTQADRLRARSLAGSGCRFARSQLAQGLWKGGEVYQSPDLDGSFRLRVGHLQSGHLDIVCTGHSGRVEFEQRSSFP